MKFDKNVNIGEYIEIQENLEDDEENSFYNTKLKVVGIVKSPLYISRSRGTTTLGSGKISYYIYVNKENINSDIYTEINITVKGAKEISELSDEYSEKITLVENELETIKEDRQLARHTELINEATKKLDDAQKEFDDQKADAEKKIQDAEKEIADGKSKIAKSEKEIVDGEKKLQEGRDEATVEFADAQGKISEGETELIKSQEKINEANKLLESKKEEAKKGISQIETGIKTINDKISELNIQKQTVENTLNSLKEINQNIEKIKLAIAECEKAISMGAGNVDELLAQIESFKAQLKILEENKGKIEASGITQDTLNTINAGITECNNQKNSLNAQLNSINSELSSAQKQIDDGQNQINNGWNEINNSKKQLENAKAETNKKLDDSAKEIEKGKTEISKAKKQLADGEKELQENKEKFNTEIADAEAKLIDAREKVNDIENAKWYVFDREDNAGFNSYSQDTDNVRKLGEAFPIVFFVIATLISLTSMSRMVEEERVQIGTLKALGYNKLQIMSKYIIYSLLASIIGGFLGAIFGLQFFPRIIISMYQMMYNITEMTIEFNKYYAFLGMGIMSLCIVGATIYTATKELSSTPAEMMRPKAPKAGKRVLLEKIPFIWNRLNFTQKVTIRNMFRYKKRFLMTVVGIMRLHSININRFRFERFDFKNNGLSVY